MLIYLDVARDHFSKGRIAANKTTTISIVHGEIENEYIAIVIGLVCEAVQIIATQGNSAS